MTRTRPAATFDELLDGDAIEIAAGLLGWRLRTALGDETAEVLITETEAYGGADDPASHAHRGKSARNAAMFGPAGTLYVYRSYGIHWCMNVVAGPEGAGSAVLVRAGVPTLGRAVMERRRGRRDHLSDGPGKVCQALGVSGDQNGTSLRDGPVQLLPGTVPEGRTVATTRRIGITKAADRPWRFVMVSGGAVRD